MNRIGQLVVIIAMTVAITVSGPAFCQTPDSSSILADKVAALSKMIVPLDSEPDFFPLVTQFTPVPSGKGWKGEEGPLSEQVLRDTVDNIIDHGFTGIEILRDRPADEKAFILSYAQSRGMVISYHAGSLELFGRNKPPEPSVYSTEYEKAVRENAEKALAHTKTIPRLYNVFTYQDEPFHWGPDSFGFGDDVKKAFRTRYGYDLPADIDSIRDDPVKWLDVINFRSDNFSAGWRKVYPIIKDINPNFIATLTHDSHNTFGAGYGSHSELAIDDIYHWGGDFSDMFVFDIYPYMMIDFRFGALSQLPLPRISQAHYSFAQMRNLTTGFGKKLGFWVGTYNPAWFKKFMCEELRNSYWSEQEMSMTAVAQGSDYLLTGYHIPIDPRHWENFGDGNRLIQRTGGELLNTPKVKAKACMLFPRTHYIQMQEEYFNVGLSYELFLRAFGELDIIHEEQIVDDSLNGYELLVLFDVKLLPEKTAGHIASFVRNGGVVIADCVPAMNEFRKPMTVMEELFGVSDSATDRIVRTGHYIPFKTEEPIWDFREKNAPDETIITTDRLKGDIFGQTLDMTIVSPRPCHVTSGTVLARTAGGKPAVLTKTTGKGRAFLLGFCLQDSYFKTWQDNNREDRSQLRGLLGKLTENAGVRSHVWSSNPDIEAAVRAHDSGGFLFVINHEANDPKTEVRIAGLDFTIGAIIDLETGGKVTIERTNRGIELKLTAAHDNAKIFRLVKQ